MGNFKGFRGKFVLNGEGRGNGKLARGLSVSKGRVLVG